MKGPLIRVSADAAAVLKGLARDEGRTVVSVVDRLVFGARTEAAVRALAHKAVPEVVATAVGASVTYAADADRIVPHPVGGINRATAVVGAADDVFANGAGGVAMPPAAVSRCPKCDCWGQQLNRCERHPTCRWVREATG